MNHKTMKNAYKLPERVIVSLKESKSDIMKDKITSLTVADITISYYSDCVFNPFTHRTYKFIQILNLSN